MPFINKLGFSYTPKNEVLTDGEMVYYNTGCIFSPTSLPEVESIRDYCFAGCYANKDDDSGESELVLPDTVKSIGKYAFSDFGCNIITINEGVTEIPERCFYGAYDTTVLNLPSTITSIGDCAFANMDALSDIKLPPNLKSIGKYVFQEGVIEEISLPHSLEVISTDAFANAYSLKNVKFAEGLKEIQPDAFSETQIKKMVFPKTLERIDSKAFAGINAINEENPAESAERLDFNNTYVYFYSMPKIENIDAFCFGFSIYMDFNYSEASSYIEGTMNPILKAYAIDEADNYTQASPVIYLKDGSYTVTYDMESEVYSSRFAAYSAGNPQPDWTKITYSDHVMVKE